MSVSHHAAPTATPVTVHQGRPLAVEIWPTVMGTVIRVLLGVLAVLHAVTCVAVLYALYTAAQMLQALADGFDRFGAGLGG